MIAGAMIAGAMSAGAMIAGKPRATAGVDPTMSACPGRAR